MEGLPGEPCFPALAFSLKGGGVLYEPSCLLLRLLTRAERFIAELALTPAGQMRLFPGEPYLLPLAFSLKGGGVLYEPSCPPLRPLTHGEGSKLGNYTIQPWGFHSRGMCSLRTYYPRSRDF